MSRPVILRALFNRGSDQPGVLWEELFDDAADYLKQVAGVPVAK